MENRPSSESELQAAKWDAIGRVAALATLPIMAFLALIIHLAWPQFLVTVPWLLGFFEACIVVLVVGSIYGLFRHMARMGKLRAERYQHETYRFPVDYQGNFPAYFDQQAKRFIQASPGNMQVPVPQSLTYAPHFEYKDSSNRMLPEPEQDTFQAGLAPTIEEVINALPRNGFQICLGRSLTTGELLQIELPDNHIKLIGSSRKGKSCEAGAILEQIQQTHDPLMLQFALLDLEYKTSRLFERSAHVAYIQAGRRGKVPAIARDPDEVALWLRYLREEMDRRYKVPAQQKTQLPYILAYIEEFLDLRRRLKGQVLTDAIDNFTSLATRGLKERIGLMICAQVDYSDESLRDAMGQFNGANIAFSVKPSAARSAGFIDNELLNRNYASKIPGQFVVEATGINDLGVSPQFDVRQKLAALDGLSGSASQVQAGFITSIGEAPESDTHQQRTSNAPEDTHQAAPGWQAYYDQVVTLYAQGYRNQDQIIEKIFHVKKGGNEKWYGCREIVQQCLAAIRESEDQA